MNRYKLSTLARAHGVRRRNLRLDATLGFSLKQRIGTCWASSAQPKWVSSSVTIRSAVDQDDRSGRRWEREVDRLRGNLDRQLRCIHRHSSTRRERSQIASAWRPYATSDQIRRLLAEGRSAMVLPRLDRICFAERGVQPTSAEARP